MKHGDFLIDIVDEKGAIIGRKKRRDVNKLVDRFHGVYVLMVTESGELVLGGITERNDLPNIYAHRWGVTSAAIRRSNETANETAVRTLQRELLIRDADVKLLGQGMVTMVDERQLFMSAYYFVSEVPRTYSTVDIESLKPMFADQFEEALQSNPDRFAPTLQAFWAQYRDKLPI
ncbi:MAG TPA: hypothetical protein VMS08_05625 [Candidatus Saccharimonadia bacterium]|nr:hypothetical protein [Candidatus Saccharimonadia bacterium]